MADVNLTPPVERSFLGMRPQDFVAMLGGLLGSVPVGRPGRQFYPFQALYPLAGALDRRDQDTRLRYTVDQLQQQYGGEDSPEFRAGLALVNAGDVRGGIATILRGVTERNALERETRKREYETAGETLAGTALAPVSEPGIRSFAPIPEGVGALLSPVDATAVRDFQSTSRPPTTADIIGRLARVPDRDVRGIAYGKLLPMMTSMAEKEGERVRRADDERAALAQFGGKKALETASPEMLESIAMALPAESRLAARLNMVANHRRAGADRAAQLELRRLDSDLAQEQRAWFRGETERRRTWEEGQREREAQRRREEFDLRRQDRATDRASLDTYRQELLELRRQGLEGQARRREEAGGKLKVSERKMAQSFAAMDLWLDQAEAALKELSTAGLLPAGEGIGSNVRAWTARQRKPNAEALRKWQALQGGAVGFDRSILNEIGPRAKAAYENSLRLFDSPPTYQGGLGVFQQMREQIAEAKKSWPDLVRQKQTSEGLNPDDAEPARPAASPAAPKAAPLGQAGGITWSEVPSVTPSSAKRTPKPAGNGEVWVIAPDGRRGRFPANRPLPPGYRDEE